jgi:hypothetical protein
MQLMPNVYLAALPMIKALLVDLPNHRIREISWEGGFHTNQFDELMQIGDLDTETFKANICGSTVNIIHTCGTNDGRFGWQLINYPHWTFYSSSVILGEEDASYPYSGFHVWDCAITPEQLRSNINWVRMQWDKNTGMMVRELKWTASSDQIE